jgi:hypothetical protein
VAEQRNHPERWRTLLGLAIFILVREDGYPYRRACTRAPFFWYERLLDYKTL